jgi:hypothetical protein
MINLKYESTLYLERQDCGLRHRFLVLYKLVEQKKLHYFILWLVVWLMTCNNGKEASLGNTPAGTVVPDLFIFR